MSMQRCPQAQLAEHRGPVYPTMVVEVANAFTARSSIGMNSVLVERAAAQCQGYRGIRLDLTTDDGYRWYVAAVFDTFSGRVVVAIPMANDTDCHDNTRLDRSPAAYLHGMASTEDANALAAKFAQSLRRVQG